MAFTIDPQTLIGNAISGFVNMPIIIGLPSNNAPIPNFIFSTIPDESASGSVTLPALQLTSGQLLMKSAVESGTYTVTVVLSDTVNFPAIWYQYVATALQQVSSISNSIANYGSVLPNLSSITTNFVNSQLTALYAIKNGMQPVLILNSYILLGAISQTNPNLDSNWYIESIDILREEAEGGLVVQLQMKELLSKRDSQFSSQSIVTNIAGEIVSPLAGSLLGAFI